MRKQTVAVLKTHFFGTEVGGANIADHIGRRLLIQYIGINIISGKL